MAQWGIWDILGLLVALVPSVLVLVYLFPRKAIDSFYIDTSIRSINESYPKVILVELRNHTNDPIYVFSRGFSFGTKIRPSPQGAKNAAIELYEVKFEGREQGRLSDIDTLVRSNQVVSTWIPVDPSESDQDLSSALKSRQVGTLRLICQKISSRPHPYTKLNIPV
jgi:hypothetical protein